MNVERIRVMKGAGGSASVAFFVLALSLGHTAVGEAQAPIRVGASLSKTGTYAELGQALFRGYSVCLKQANEKGGVLGRRIELLVEDDQSQPATAAAIYERLITQDKVEAVLSPYSSPITDVVADLTEKHRMPMVAAGAVAPSIWKKGRQFVFMALSPVDAYVEGLFDTAARAGLKTVAVIYEDTLFPKSIAQAAQAGATKHGLRIVGVEAYPRATTDFTAPLTKIRAANPDVLVAATYFDDAVAVTRQMKDLGVNPRMHSVSVGGDLPKFYEVLGRAAEFVYGATQWEPELVGLRAGGLIPIARQYPGARELVELHRREFPGADISYQTGQGIGGCQVLLEGIRRAGTLDGEKVRDAISKLDVNTAFGAFKVNREGAQVAHKMLMFQWQDGKKVIVWPNDLAPGTPRLPTPPWSQR
jgi:branched-chain amino acid transport system substrate-binding protein